MDPRSYFVAINIVQGFLQSIGWPSVVAVVARWWGHDNRGLIMGVWNAHTSVGNIMGARAAIARRASPVGSPPPPQAR